MDRQDRLKLLFDEEDESLLELNTGLNGMSTTESHSGDKTPLIVVTDIDVQPLKNDTEVGAIAQPKHATKDDAKESIQAGEQPRFDIPKRANIPLDGIAGLFCPLLAMSRYPYKFIKGELSQKVASGFFDRAQFWNRQWDVYYVYIPPQLGLRPLLLIPVIQAQEFLQEINHKLETKLTIPEEDNMGMLLDFSKGNLPQPTFIGQCASREEKDSLEATIPVCSYRQPSKMTEELLAYEQMIENAVEASKNKNRSKQSKARKQKSRMQIERGLIETRKRMSCYFGLKPYGALDLPELIDDRSWEEQRCKKKFENVDEPMLHVFWKEPIFISVDVECNERCHEQVTEVGISTLDTLDLVGISPGGKAVNWTSRIRSRHMRVREYGHIVNHHFISGCPGNFEFGESEWVPKEELVDAVQGCFQPPYSCGNEDTDGVQLSDPPEYKRNQRNLVLVGHNTAMDVRYLRSLGIKIFEDITAGFLETIDTAELYRHMRCEPSQRSLGAVLEELGIIGWHLHNAGNDARYTLEAMVRMVVRDAGHGERAELSTRNL